MSSLSSLLRVILAFTALSSTWAWSSHDPQKALQIFLVDVEGGQATLFVTPAHQSLLVGTGWDGNSLQHFLGSPEFRLQGISELRHKNCARA
jgi:hypothetical protein